MTPVASELLPVKHIPLARCAGPCECHMPLDGLSTCVDLLEEFLINFLNVQGLLDNTAYAMKNH